MASKDRIIELLALAAMKRDRDQAKLAQAAMARAATRAQIEALRASTSAPVPDDPILFGVQQRHRLWAEGQRRALNQVLAQQSATWHDARECARRSFGRAEVLGQIVRDARAKAARHT